MIILMSGYFIVDVPSFLKLVFYFSSCIPVFVSSHYVAPHFPSQFLSILLVFFQNTAYG